MFVWLVHGNRVMLFTIKLLGTNFMSVDINEHKQNYAI